MPPVDPLVAARQAAAQYLRGRGYTADAQMVEAGEADDLREMEIALALVKILHVAPTPPTRIKGRRIVGEEC